MGTRHDLTLTGQGPGGLRAGASSGLSPDPWLCFYLAPTQGHGPGIVHVFIEKTHTVVIATNVPWSDLQCGGGSYRGETMVVMAIQLKMTISSLGMKILSKKIHNMAQMLSLRLAVSPKVDNVRASCRADSVEPFANVIGTDPPHRPRAKLL